MLAESHQHLLGTTQLTNFFRAHGWNATASPARPTERSEERNTAGVAVAITNHPDSMPVAFCTNPEGKLTPNAQFTGRLLTLDWVGIRMLAGYLERSLGFVGTNHDFIVELEFVARGGNQPFILGLDANSKPEEWNGVRWGEENPRPCPS